MFIAPSRKLVSLRVKIRSQNELIGMHFLCCFLIPHDHPPPPPPLVHRTLSFFLFWTLWALGSLEGLQTFFVRKPELRFRQSALNLTQGFALIGSNLWFLLFHLLLLVSYCPKINYFASHACCKCTESCFPENSDPPKVTTFRK